jgi:anti-sigma-K factor RskA
VTSRLSHSEIQELLGAYALDAVDRHEAADIEDHLRECPRCRAEVIAHRETAALLVDTHLEPPTELWDRVAADLEEVVPPLDLSRFVPRGRPRRRLAPAWVATAAALVALLAVGALTYRQQQKIADVEAGLRDQELAVAALAAFDDPEARHSTLRAGDGSLQVRAVVLPDGTGYLLADRLPSLSEDRTYQLWAMIDGQPVSAGVLGPDPSVMTFRVHEGTSALAISEEAAGGADRPTLPVTMTGLIEA